MIKYLEQHCAKNDIPNLDHTKNLDDMKLRPKTRAFLCLIYRNVRKIKEKNMTKETQLENQRKLQEE